MRKTGFTLVELIVVITILAVLGTIGFLSFQGYAKSARDSTRISDLKVIAKALELYKVEADKYPEPSGKLPVTFQSSIVWEQGTIGESVSQQVKRLAEPPKDPLTGSEYTYSLTYKKAEYQLGAVFETDLNGYLSKSIDKLETYAAGDREGLAYVKGFYNQKTISIQIGNILYILAVPTIINGDMSIQDLEELIRQGKLVVHGKYNVPDSYKDSDYKAGGDLNVVNTGGLVVFSGSSSDLTGGDSTARKELALKLQAAYSGTVSETAIPEVAAIVETNSNDNFLLDDIAKTVVTQETGETVENSNVVPSVQNCRVSNGDGTQEWGGLDWNACEMTSCDSGYTDSSGTCTQNTWDALADWSSCSQTCGGGTQTQTVQCKNSSGTVISDGSCTTAKPSTTQACNTQSCTTYAWNSTSWGSCSGGTWSSYGGCSATCGGGTQTRACNTAGNQSRSVVCEATTGGVTSTVADGLCSGTKPTTSQSCSQSCSGSNTRSCNTHSCYTYSWQTSGYGSCSGGKYWSGYGGCSASCGGGTQYRSCVGSSGSQTRSVTCRRSDGSTVSDSYCGGGKPTTTISCNTTCSGSNSRSCNTHSCYSYSWSTGGWGSCSGGKYWSGYSGCSVSCGSGTRSRSCLGSAGSQSRSVYCRRSDGASVSDYLCGGGRPSSSTSCNTSCSGSSSTSCNLRACVYYIGVGTYYELQHVSPPGCNGSGWTDTWQHIGNPNCNSGYRRNATTISRGHIYGSCPQTHKYDFVATCIWNN